MLPEDDLEAREKVLGHILRRRSVDTFLPFEQAQSPYSAVLCLLRGLHPDVPSIQEFDAYRERMYKRLNFTRGKLPDLNGHPK